MPSKCVVEGCSNRGGFSFPKDPELNLKWCIAINVPLWLSFVWPILLLTESQSIPAPCFLHNLFCLSHWHKPQGNAAAFGRASLTVSSNMVAFGRLGPAGPKSTHMKLRGDLCLQCPAQVILCKSASPRAYLFLSR